MSNESLHDPDSQSPEQLSGDKHLPSQQTAKDYLENSFNKFDLQKQCRDLAFQKILVTKSELMDKIL